MRASFRRVASIKIGAHSKFGGGRCSSSQLNSYIRQAPKTNERRACSDNNIPVDFWKMNYQWAKNFINFQSTFVSEGRIEAV